LIPTVAHSSETSNVPWGRLAIVALPFDPYRQWLRIDGGRDAADFYQVFGLPAFTSDPQVIAVAADLTIERVQRLSPGAHRAAHRRLLEELSQAKECLLDPAARARYDQSLGGHPNSGLRPIAAQTPTSPTVSSERTTADELWDELAEEPRRRYRLKRRSRSSGILAAGLILLGAVSVLGGVAYWQMQTGRPMEMAAGGPNHDVSKGAPQHDPPSTVAAPAAEPDPPPSPVSSPQVSPTPRRGETRPAVKNPVQPPPARVNSPPQSPHVATPEPENPKAADDPQRAERIAAFEWAVQQARAALAARDLDKASGQLDAAEKNIVLPRHLDEVRQLRALAGQLRLFFDAVRSGLKKFEPTEQIDVDGLIAAIVEVKPDGVTLFVERSRKSYTLATMPANTVLFFARAGADENNPLAAAFYGAFYAIQGDRDKARQAWQRAAAADVPVDDLLPLLSGPPLGSRRVPVPEAKLLDAARVELQGRFADEIVAAQNPVRKSVLASKLLDAAGGADNAAEQFAALTQARQWAILAGDPMAALAAIDEMGRSFEVDPLELKSQALGLALAGKMSAKSAASAAAAAIDLSSAAERAGRGDLALSLADTAYNAARKSRDSALIKRAYSRRTEAQAFSKQSRSRKAKSSSSNR
jgi:hypothetical protein